ncbi:MAG: TIGR02757 family protein [Bacteroidales bacterium]|nr:TIGR02757 family protein [Bacteroidales bacterium]
MNLDLDFETLKGFLDEKYEKFNNPNFIEDDPIQIPHLFNKKEDIEISGFITSTIAWGKRNSIIKSAKKFIDLMDNSPYEFVISHSAKDLKRFENAVHRTFNGEDLKFFIISLKNIYENYGGLENILTKTDNIFNNLSDLHKIFFSIPHLQRTKRHLANVESGSAAKRLNMFLRWMIRKDNRGVDFGIWKNISSADLYIPLDVHSGRIARLLGLLERKQNDWKAVDLLTKQLRKFDSKDPVKYDFALFGIGVNEDF